MSGCYRAKVWRTGACALLFAVSRSAAAAPDVELGRYLSAECATCHRAANAPGTIPTIHGRAEQTLVELIKAYRDKTRANPVMQTIAGRLKDDEIEALAAYFARTPKP
jgi:cytochrome c553